MAQRSFRHPLSGVGFVGDWSSRSFATLHSGLYSCAPPALAIIRGIRVIRGYDLKCGGCRLSLRDAERRQFPAQLGEIPEIDAPVIPHDGKTITFWAEAHPGGRSIAGGRNDQPALRAGLRMN